MSETKNKSTDVVKVYAKDLKKEITTLVYVNDKLKLTSKDATFVNGFVDGIKSLNNADVLSYSVELSEDNPVKDPLSWLYSKSGGMQVFSAMKERIDVMTMVEIIQE